MSKKLIYKLNFKFEGNKDSGFSLGFGISELRIALVQRKMRRKEKKRRKVEDVELRKKTQIEEERAREDARGRKKERKKKWGNVMRRNWGGGRPKRRYGGDIFAMQSVCYS